MNYEHTTTYPPRTGHVPQSHELASEEVRRQVEAQKQRDRQEQEAADHIRRLIFHGPNDEFRP